MDRIPIRNNFNSFSNHVNIVLFSLLAAGRCLHASGGTSTPGDCCVFPFKFKGQLHNSCLPFGGDKKRRWCSLSHDFDAERRWGMCSSKFLETFVLPLVVRAFENSLYLPGESKNVYTLTGL